MKIFISSLTKITDTKYSIGYQHNMPLDSENGIKHDDGTLYTEDELNSIGKLIDEPVKPEVPVGKIIVMYYNPTNNTLFYEVDEPSKTQEQTTQDRLTAIEIAIANMMGV